MSEQLFATSHISDLAVPLGPQGYRWAMVRVHFGIEAFGVNAYVADEAGAQLVGEHDEMGERAGQHEELYFVGSGDATFTVGGEEVAAPAGTFVFVRDPATRRGAVANEAGTTIVAVGGPAGKAFVPSRWERSAPGLALFGRGEYAKAAELLAAAHAEHPDDAGILYNLACAESLAGQHDEAFEHLRRAIELSPDFRELAAKDADLDSLRDDPRFTSAIAGQSDPGGARS